MKSLQYKLHWASGSSPHKKLKWVIYDWCLKCPVAYTVTRKEGRKLTDFLNYEFGIGKYIK